MGMSALSRCGAFKLGSHPTPYAFGTVQIYTVEPSGILPIHSGISSHVIFASDDGSVQKKYSLSSEGLPEQESRACM